MPVPTGAKKLTKEDFLALTDGCEETFYLVLTRLRDEEPEIVFEGMSGLRVQSWVHEDKKFKGKRTVLFYPDPATTPWAEYVVDERPGPNDQWVDEEGNCMAEDFYMEVYRV